MNKLGIIQGRLSPPIEGFQECPVEWKKEFELLPELGLEHIEWIVTKNSLNNNPVLSEELSGYPVSSICLDNLVDYDFHEKEYLNHNLKPFCELAIKNDIKRIAIPLLEKSSVVDDRLRLKFSKNIKEYSQNYPDLDFLFEVEASSKKLIDLLSISDNFYVTYDTGNITSCGFNHKEYINDVYDRIKNVHLKDRTYEAVTVPPSDGDTNFKLIFNILKEKMYNDLYTLQTAREVSGEEYTTIQKHKNILMREYNE